MNIARKAPRGGDVPTSAADLEAAIVRADADLRAALLAGISTEAARSRLADIRAGAARLAAERAAAEAQRHADEAAAVAAAADTIAVQAAARLAARQPLPIQHPKALQMQHPAAITAAAGQVAASATRAAAADARLHQAVEAETSARGLIDALAARRVAIVGRRQSGQHDPEDGATLALIAADGEGLAALLAEAKVVTDGARAHEAEGRRALALAREALAQAEAEIEIGAVVAHLGALDSAVVASLGRLNELQAALHRSGLPFIPSVEMAQGLRRLLAQAGRL